MTRRWGGVTRAPGAVLAAGLPLLVACSAGVSASVTAASAPGGPACVQDAGGQVCVTAGAARLPSSSSSVASSSAGPGASPAAGTAGATGSTLDPASAETTPASSPAVRLTPSGRGAASTRPSVRATGATGASAAWGGGHRVGRFPTQGTVAVSWRDKSYRGAVTGTCDVASDVRTAEVSITQGGVLVVEVTSAYLAKVTIGDGDGHTWSQEYVGDATGVIALGPQRLQVRRTTLPYEDPNESPATIEAVLDC